MLAHNVYFTLKEQTDAARKQLVAECQTYLKNHPGVVFFAAGVLEPELARPVNDRAFDVALHVVFASRADHDAYQVAANHQVFIDRNRDRWATVRVFDSLVS